ncbi:MAG: hypothetical protein L6M37_00900 [Candidatus Methylarchaceae archaeon HK02M1]|nr:hypothetical protein [Candidatus Methylarchaceae archaeon HK02M1]
MTPKGFRSSLRQSAIRLKWIVRTRKWDYDDDSSNTVTQDILIDDKDGSARFA